ncbi:MAG: hypothetical protein RL616_305 [Verrucomicrobiota bacterium]
MKIKIAIIVLIVACLGLGVALFATKKQSEEQHSADVTSINSFSNQVVEANDQLKDLSQANLALTNDLALSRQQTLELSNALAVATLTLDQTRANLVDAQTQVTNLSIQITELETQNKVLDQRAEQLTNTIAQLNTLIAATQGKLAQADINNAYLQDALQKQMAQKAELEHKFSDINEVRAQVKKLKDEMFVARRMQLSKTDPSGKKGAELLKPQPLTPEVSAPAKTSPAYDLNVEVGSDGSVKIIPPGGATNAPAK